MLSCKVLAGGRDLSRFRFVCYLIMSVQRQRLVRRKFQINVRARVRARLRVCAVRA
jgi:hypothetical protein